VTRYYTLIFLFLYYFQSSAQFAVGSLDLNGDIDTWYNETIGYENLAFLEGAYYPVEAQNIKHHQFYRSLSWLNGTIAIDGRVFKNVKVLYNTYRDVLIALNIGMEVYGVQSIKLNQHRVDSFLIEEAKFIHIRSDNHPASGTGFYQKYYEGKNMKLFIKRKKERSSNSEEVIYRIKDKKYILYQNLYYEFKGKKTLFTMFPDKKKQIKKYSRASTPRVNQKNDLGLYELMSYCDQLLK